MKDKSDFFRVYANLPIDMRKEIILVIDKQPITWEVAFDEIQHETTLGKKIFKRIVELELI